MKKFILAALLLLALVGYNYRYVGYQFLGEWRIHRYFAPERVCSRGKPLAIDKTFFILLERDCLRRSFVEQQVRRADFPAPYEVFPAVDGKSLKTKCKAIFTEKAIAKLRAGECGCIMSHRTLWERVASDPQIEVALILEDDALLESDFTTKWQELSPSLPADFDLLFLYHSPRDNALVPTAASGIYHSLYLRCLHSYVITKKGAKKLLAGLFPLSKPIDIALDRYYRGQFNVWQVLGSYFGATPQEKLLIYSTMPSLSKTAVMPTNIQLPS